MEALFHDPGFNTLKEAGRAICNTLTEWFLEGWKKLCPTLNEMERSELIYLTVYLVYLDNRIRQYIQWYI